MNETALADLICSSDILGIAYAIWGVVLYLWEEHEQVIMEVIGTHRTW